MMRIGSNRASRRQFLRVASAFSAAGIASPFALQLAALGEASAQISTDYKAVVCVFLYGGNDHNNTVIPFDTASYNYYRGIRGAIARDVIDLQEVVPVTSLGGRQIALPKELAPLKALFDANHCAIIANVGTLIVPTSLTQYKNQSVPLPPKLFSHNDQQSFWQSSSPEGAQNGWAGRMGDLLMSGNGKSVFTCVASGSTDVLLAGRVSRQYAVTTAGSVAMNVLAAGANSAGGATATIRQLMTEGRAHLLESELNQTNKRSIDADTDLRAALAAAPPLATVFPSNRLALNLQIIARMISAGGALQARRQIFFTSLGGFDTHDNLLADQPPLHTQLAEAIDAFHRATVELGLADKVTLFTASDFGRTLTSNGDGSDHGWGSYHFVVGDAVKGRNVYGTLPEARLGTDTDVGNGRLLPTTSVDQYAATLGAWMGLTQSQLLDVLPNLANFPAKNLGFV